MNSNQQRALALAQDVLAGRRSPDDLRDDDWQLLLVASGFIHTKTPPALVCFEVTQNHLRREGYFAPSPTAPGAATPPPQWSDGSALPFRG